MSLASAMVRGAGWQSIATASTTVGQVAVAMVLARLLRPEDFGVVAIGFASAEVLGVLSEYGAAAAVARSHPPSRTLVRRVATRLIVVGGLTTLCAAAFGIVLERWFAMVHLAVVVTALVAATTLANLGLVLQAIAEASLDFRRVAIVDSAAYWAGAILFSIPLAALGLAHWALVIGFVGQGLVRLLAHLPLWRALTDTPATVHDERALASFSGRLTLARLFNAGVNQVDKVVLGRASGATDVGLYSRPMLLVTQISTAAGAVYDRVLYPVFARIQHQSADLLADQFLRAAAFIALVLTPVAVLVASESTALIGLLFGAGWESAAGVLRWGALALPGLAVVRVCDTLARSVGRPGRSVMLKAIYVAVLFPAVLIGANSGAVGVAIAVAVAASIMAIVQVGDAVRTAGGKTDDLLRVAGRIAPLLAALGGAVALSAYARPSSLAARPLLALAVTAIGALVLSATVLAIDGRVGGRALAWLLSPFRVHIPASAQRWIGGLE